jgi:hypothetical protein
MSAPSRAFALSFAFVLALDAAFASDDGVWWGELGCARPFVPACADAPATYQNAEDVSACKRDLDRFALATAAYRDCLERQIAGAVRQANDALDHFRCLSRRECPPVARRP